MLLSRKRIQEIGSKYWEWTKQNDMDVFRLPVPMDETNLVLRRKIATDIGVEFEEFIEYVDHCNWQFIKILRGTE